MTEIKNSITHTGIVIGSKPKGLLVQFSVGSDGGDCSGCAISSVCNSASSEKVIVTAIADDPFLNIEHGTKVRIVARGNIRRRATTLLLAIPLAAMLIAALVADACAASETISAISAITAAIVSLIGVAFTSRRGKALWVVTDIIKGK